ncbi:cysteine-rich receptor-like protein kinase 2 [Phtheirospermum japonicum]|uniref:Cysteine-rich receptor-like protein kinase 2 n=1 Tax=Phtheirospermum japonicum TaxID=374723 RepID=A0A830D5X4_9LAMI|nr:cysteine-rich receptor-like protein kinase 2 [Phtheirospermum japonicum]
MKKEKNIFPYVTILVILLLPDTLFAEPRTQTVSFECGSQLEHNVTLYVPNFVSTMENISTQIRVAGFGVAQTGSGPDTNYGLAQCYGDLSLVDCVLCYAEARTLLPQCYPMNGGRIYLDGCFMRSENFTFYREFTGPRDRAVCGNITRRDPAFQESTRRAVSQAVSAAGNNNGFARARVAISGTANGSVYVLAECWRTISPTDCRACLENATASILGCLPSSEGRALNTGCFMRYSDRDFLNPETGTGSSRGRVIAIVIASVSAAAVLITGAYIGFYIWSNKVIQNKRKGDAQKLVKTLHDSSLNFKYSTLEKATGSFDEANKLGQGGFGTAYKGVLPDGREIAVKRLFFNNKHRSADFYNEVNIISSVEHPVIGLQLLRTRKPSRDAQKLVKTLHDSSLNFKYSTLEKATGSFDEANKLGQGGFGTVYKEKADHDEERKKYISICYDSVPKSASAGFGVAQTGSGPDTNYGLAQCYGDLSLVDCVLCYAEARTLLPQCYPMNGGRIYLDGCFMRSENFTFYREFTGPRDRAVCGNITRRDPAFQESTRRAVSQAVSAAGNNNGFARARVAISGTANGSVYVFGRVLEDDKARRIVGLVWRMRPRRVIAIVIASVSAAAVLITGAYIGFYIWSNKVIQNKRKGDAQKLVKTLHDSSLNFKYSTLEKATGSFDEANKLGQGGFGTVYKGVLPDGREIAVKRLFFNNKHRAADFYNEVNIISSVEHKNLVRLLGCSCSGPESLLVYEFLPNKSLDRFIFDSSKGKALNWEKRFEIIIGTAEGLVYLHENTKIRIIHRDIKSSNILLDSRLRAKIADFGLARSFQEDKSHISTAIAGTLGYMAPEYLAHGQLTEKADVYSFGVLLLEIVTGRQNNRSKASEYTDSLISIGVLPDGREIAVKRLFFNNKHRAADFYNEVNIISSVEHKNLVRLLGCSCSGPESLLVYEFLPNKSLDRFIFDSSKGKALNWEKRFEIIIGTAEGLVYLHENTKIRIIHRDIKSSNILLDSRLRAKIADFGLARSFQEDKSHISTAIAGTLGYMAPEYLAHGQLTEKADVYSFGVLLLEIVTGRQNNRSKASEYTDSLISIVWKHFQQRTAEELLDPNLMHHNYHNNINVKNEMLRVVHVGLLCTQEIPTLRPSMSRALLMLVNKDELPAPTNPPFMDERTMELHDMSVFTLSPTGHGDGASIASISQSIFYPR